MVVVRSEDSAIYNAGNLDLKKEIQELLARTEEMVRSAIAYAEVLQPGDTGPFLEAIKDNAEETQKLLTALKKGGQP